MITKWQNRLGLQDYKILTSKISNEQVVYPSDCEKEFVGVCIVGDEATIYHTRDLTEEDIIHELLHVKYPSVDHDWINSETERLNGEDGII